MPKVTTVKIKSIKNHIIKSSLLIVLIPMIILGIYSIVTSYISAYDYVGSNVENTAKLASENIRLEMKSIQNVAIETGGKSDIFDTSVPNDVKQSILDSIAAGYGFERGNFINAEGIGLDGNSYTDREYYQKAMQGIAFVSEPVVSKITGKITIIIAAPVWKDGIFGTESVGCIYFVPNEEFLNEILKSVNISENGNVYILNKSGTVIASCDPEDVKNNVNFIEAAKTDKQYKGLAECLEKAVALEYGNSMYYENALAAFVGYAPIDGSDGWSVAVCAPASDFLGMTYATMEICLVIIVLAGVISVFSSRLMGSRVGTPISVCTERIKKLSEGDISSPVPTVNTEDETKILADATETLVNDINGIISDIGYMLKSMAEGNFAVSSKCPEEVYCGDFHVLIDSVNEINAKLNSALSQINDSSDQVSSGSEQVSSGAQTLSQSASEQASSVEKLAESIHEVKNKLEETSLNCSNGAQLVDETVGYIGKAAEEMNSLTAAMKEIDEATEEIGKIIKAIEDIAFQTNILALNAAVEAAHAGEAGKGFAVVADEVRNLAAKSAKAAKDTTSLIEKTVTAVGNGTNIAALTAESVDNVDKRSGEVKRIMDEISTASFEQENMVNEINGGIEQISAAVQNTSSIAEESASASEELSGQAQMLKDLVGAFKLKQ